MAKTTVAQGVVTGFGSVIVNGVHYDVEDAAIDVDGDSTVESDLGVGQIVRITATMGENGRGKASKLEGESQVRGAIESIDLTTGILVAVGQTIILNTDTFYQDGVTADTLKVGDIIKVSAYTNADGALVATRIDVKTGADADVAQLAGQIADLDTTALTFTINGKTVDYSQATVADETVLANDMVVRVHGSIVNDVFVATGTLKASPLNIKHDDQIGEHDGLRIGGLITDLVTDTSFKINDATVLLNADTKYEGGTAADLFAGLLVKVQGTLDADNNLVATEIRLILHPQVNENGLVETVDTTANTFSVNGVTFEVTVDTSFNDSGRDKVRLFSLSDLAVGNTINVHGYKVDATDTIPEHMVATRVERRNPSTNSADHFKVEVHGLVESVTASTINVAGHDITVTADTEITGFDSLEAFLAAAVGTNVEIKGAIENNVLVATSIEPADDESHSWLDHSDSSHSANSSAASMPSGGFPSHSDSSRSAPSDDEAHSFSSRSFSSRSEMNPGSAPSESMSSRAARSRSSDESHSFSSRSAMNPGSAPSDSMSSRSAHSRNSDESHSFSSRSAKSAPSSKAASSSSSEN